MRQRLGDFLHRFWQFLVQEMRRNYVRLSLFLPVFFGLGIVGYFSLGFEPSLVLTVSLAAILSIMLWLFYRWLHRVLPLSETGSDSVTYSGTDYKFKFMSLFLGLFWLGLFVLFLLFGTIAAQVRTHYLSHPVLSQAIGPVVLTGRVVIVDHKSFGRRLILDRVEFSQIEQQRLREKYPELQLESNLPAVVRINFRGTIANQIELGSWVRVYARLSPIPPPNLPNGFDYQRFMYFYGVTFGIGSSGFSTSSPQVISPPSGYKRDWLVLTESLRVHITNHIMEHLEGDEGAVVAALVSGDRARISEGAMEAIRNSGLAHFLSISGLHISIIAVFVIFFLRGVLSAIPYCVHYWPIKQISAVVALFGVTAYSTMAGLDDVPVLRSLVMIDFFLVALLLRRRIFSLKTILWAVMTSLILTPDQVLNASLLRSYLSVLALVTVSEMVNWQAPKLHGIANLPKFLGKWVLVGIVASLVTTVATAPSSAYQFGETAIYGVIANFFAVPLTEFMIMPLVVFQLVLMPFGLDSTVLWLLGLSDRGLLAIAYATSSLPQAVVYNETLSGGYFLIMTLGGLFFCLWHGSLRWLGLVVMAGFFVISSLGEPPQLMINNSGKRFALHMPNQPLIISHGGISRVTVNEWSAAIGKPQQREDTETLIKWAKANPGGGIDCDEYRCEITAFATPLVWLREREPEASTYLGYCQGREWVILSAAPLENCTEPQLLIDPDFTFAQGATLVWLNRPMHWQSVKQTRAPRPWTVELVTTPTVTVESQNPLSRY